MPRQEFHGAVEQVVTNVNTYNNNWPETAPPDDPEKSVQCPQCGRLTWRETRHCIHCQLDLFRRAASDRRRRRFLQVLRIVAFIGKAVSMKSRVVVALLIVASICAAAEAHAAPPIESLRNVELGMPASAVAECARDATGAYYLDDKEAGPAPCIAKAYLPMARGYKYLQLIRLPRIDGLGSAVGIELLDGNVHQIEIVTLSSNFEPVLQALVAKYGPPTATESRTFRNGMGQESRGRSARWVAPNGLLELDEHRNGQPDNGYITLTSNEYLRSIQERGEKAAGELKAKL